MTPEEKAREYLLKEHYSPLNVVMHQCDLKAEMQYHEDIENAFIKGAEWKELKMIEKLKEMEIEDGDIEDFANEKQSGEYGFSEKFISCLKKTMEE